MPEPDNWLPSSDNWLTESDNCLPESDNCAGNTVVCHMTSSVRISSTALRGNPFLMELCSSTTREAKNS